MAKGFGHSLAACWLSDTKATVRISVRVSAIWRLDRGRFTCGLSHATVDRIWILASHGLENPPHFLLVWALNRADPNMAAAACPSPSARGNARGCPRWKPEHFCFLISEVTNVCPIGWGSGDHRSSYFESNGQKKNYCCYILFVRDNKLLGQVTQPNLHQGKTIEQGQGCQSCGSLGALSFGVLQRKWTSRMYERERMKEKEKLKCTLRDWPTQLWDLASLKYSR